MDGSRKAESSKNQKGSSMIQALDPSFALPHSLEAERSVVSSVMQIPKLIPSLPRGICDAIHTPGLRTTLETICNLHDAGEPTDAMDLVQALRDRKQLDNVGGASGIADLMTFCPAPTRLAHYAKRVIEDATRRRMIALANEVTASAYNPAIDFGTIRDRLQTGALEIESQASDDSMGRDLADCIQDAMDAAQELAKADGLLGLPTGIPLLDEYTTGFRPGLNVICGRPSMGKSAFALQCAIAAVHAGKKVGFFSLEMDGAETGDRAVSHMAGVRLLDMAKGAATQGDIKKFNEAIRSIPRGMFTIDDRPGRNMTDIRRMARHWVRDRGVDGIFVDQLSFVDIDHGRNDTAAAIIGKITRGLHSLGQALNVPVVLLAQLNREAEGRRPDKSHLKNSGSIEEDARLILSPFREDPNDPENNAAEIIPLKTRGVAMFHPVRCVWDGPRQAFRQAESQIETISQGDW